MAFKTTHRLLRACIARFVCLLHISLSIFILYSVKKELFYLLPIIGAFLLICEAILVLSLNNGKEPASWFSTLFFIYVCTIVACYWFLELENIKQTLNGQMKPGAYFFTSVQELMQSENMIAQIRIMWSQVELQVFFALVILIRWLIPKSSLSPQSLAELLFKYFAISCDMLDFLNILTDVVLIQYERLVYWVLSVWSWSTIQFFVFVPKYEDIEKREFNGYITNSLLSALLLDLPYLGVRCAAIFFYGSHNYNSYFFATKNFVMILLQIVRIQATFSERTIRMTKAAAAKLKQDNDHHHSSSGQNGSKQSQLGRVTPTDTRIHMTRMQQLQRQANRQQQGIASSSSSYIKNSTPRVVDRRPIGENMPLRLEPTSISQTMNEANSNQLSPSNRGGNSTRHISNLSPIEHRSQNNSRVPTSRIEMNQPLSPSRIEPIEEERQPIGLRPPVSPSLLAFMPINAPVDTINKPSVKSRQQPKLSPPTVFMPTAKHTAV